ncbi:MAG: Uma2 family endonuclease [Gemmataceae bacterium]|nr:Uma2 family endonuclease [Gemmataceae bacterium]
MAETDLHWEWMVRLKQILRRWFAKDSMTYVSGNLLMYYEPGNKRKHITPDVFVVFGVPKKNRNYYLCWEEKKYPSVIIEVTSTSTRSEDTKKKFALYRDVMGVKEYFLFDPRAEYLSPRLRGFQLVRGQYVPMSLIHGRYRSKQLRLDLQEVGSELHLIDPATNRRLLSPEEQLAETEHTMQQEIDRLRRELEKRRRTNNHKD